MYISSYPNVVLRISDGITDYYNTKNYVIFESCFIGENDKLLVDKKGTEYKILDYKEIKDYVCLQGYPCWIYTWLKRSCLKLDKPVEIGKILYLKSEY